MIWKGTAKAGIVSEVQGPGGGRGWALEPGLRQVHGEVIAGVRVSEGSEGLQGSERKKRKL